MNRFIHRALLLLLVLVPSSVAFGQGFPLPSPTPNTEVTCTIEECNGLKTVGYGLPLKTFTGRILDSHATRDYQSPIRTARAKKVRISPDGKRIYFVMGTLFAGYDKTTFFQRLESKEALMSIYRLPVNYCGSFRSGNPPGEVLLQPDSWFYAECTNFWVNTPHVDGQDRLNSFDIDIRPNKTGGTDYYAYLSHYIFNWGIVKDNGGKNLEVMPSQVQVWPGEGDAVQVLAVKDSTGHYYSIVNESTKSEMFNTDDPTNPVDIQRKLAYPLHLYAKSNNGYVALDDPNSGAIHIYTVDALVGGGSATTNIPAPPIGRWSAVASDGTNFYGVGTTSGKVCVQGFRANGASFTPQALVVSSYTGDPQISQANDGYLTVPMFAGQILIYKLDTNANPSEVVIKSSYGTGRNYFGDYYGQPPNGYFGPGTYSEGFDALVVKAGDPLTPGGVKTYLIYCDGALADVYELQDDKTLTVTATAPTGSPNPKTPVSEQAKFFYGDGASFLATTSAATPLDITWQFDDTPALQSGLTGVAKPHNYSTLVTTPRTVTATATSDPTITGNTKVTMQAPKPRITSTTAAASSLYFVLPNASAPVDLVMGSDSWFDASDGTLSGHTSSWSRYDGPAGAGTLVPPISQAPDVPYSIGGCGPHSVFFTAHYGSPDLPSASVSVDYIARPFLAAFAPATSQPDPTVISYVNGSKPGGVAATLTYKWELINNANTAVDTVTGPYSAILPYKVVKANITPNMKVRLTLTDSSGTCSGLASHSAQIILNIPDAQVTGGCGTDNGPPCSFSIRSLSRLLSDTTVPSDWKFKWSVTPATVSFPGDTNQTFTPTFKNVDLYTVACDVTNDVGTMHVTKTQPVAIVQSCPTIIPGTNVYITFNGASSSCTIAPGSLCTTGESVTLNVARFPGSYDFSCANHTFTWDFGDGTPTMTGQSVTHSFATSGNTYGIKCTVDNGSGTPALLTQNISFGTIIIPPPPPPAGCGTMTTNNVFINFTQDAGGCGVAGGNCTANQPVHFAASSAFTYSLDCGPHIYSWNFGDGSSGSGRTFDHTYTGPGTYPVSLSIQQIGTSGNQSIPLTQNITVGNGVLTCGTMTSSNVLLNYQTSGGSCTQSGGQCGVNESIAFSALSTGSYNLACGKHTFAWDFGDGQQDTAQNPTHAYGAAKTYTVTLVVTNVASSATLRLSANVLVGINNNGSCPTIVPGTNVFIQMNGPASGCSSLRTSNPCSTADDLTFVVGAFQYPLNTCATHTFDWDFGDGSAHVTDQSTHHKYAANGDYTVTLKVTVNGNTTPITQLVHVGNGVCTTGNCGQAVNSVDFSASKYVLNGIVIPNAYVFHPISDPAGVVTSWKWDFGDGQQATTTGDTLPHAYPDNKNYKITLTVVAPAGISATAVHLLQTVPAKRRGVGH